MLSVDPAFSVEAEASSGEAAVELAAERRPALVIMDVNMPGIGGIAATRRILASAPETVVVLVSAYALDDLPADARNCGAVACMSKSDLSQQRVRELWARSRR